MGIVLSKARENPAKFSVVTLALLFLRSTIGRLWFARFVKKLPPGPVPMPIIGSFYQLSPPNQPPGMHRDFYRLSQKYGPIFTLWLGSQQGVVLNTPELFYEALKVKQDETAGRPVLESFKTLTQGAGVAMNNGRRWRMVRTVLQTHVTNKQKGLESQPEIMEEVESGLHWLRQECEQGRSKDFDLRQLCRRESLNVIMRKLFSLRFSSEMSPAYMDTQDFIRVIFEHIAQGSPSDFMPIMSVFPNEEEKHYKERVKDMYAFVEKQMEEHRNSYKEKDPNDYDFLDSMFAAQAEAQKKGQETLSDLDILVVSWDSMAGGIDTSATTMEWLVYLLVNNPQVMKRAHEELDKVVGPNRLPTMDDEPNLQYITAILCEAFRFKHFAPQGLPHEAMEDITLGGYNVPKGTQIFLNFFSLHMDPKNWKDPEVFRPERFMEEEAHLRPAFLHTETFASKPESYKFCPFGQGRRRCVGYGLGRIILWLKAAMWLHCFRFESPDGKPADIDTEVLGITMMPAEQKVRAVPRPAAGLLKTIDGTGVCKEL